MGCWSICFRAGAAMAHDLGAQVRRLMGVGVAEARPLGGGCVGEVWRARLTDGREAVVKVDRRAAPCLDTEGFMLECLGARGALPVPEVLAVSPEVLVMTLVPGESRFNAGAQAHAAELLAGLHGVRGDAHGLERDTLIGGLHQPNTRNGSWVAFFRDMRILHMADMALAEGRMPAGLHRRLRALCERLDEHIEEPEHPSLLHGDVWTTNVLALDGRITGFIDPAVYFGHPEIELAFITLFSTFGGPFFEAYQALRPMRPGFFEVRRDIYNIYPLLVHARLFGAGYLSGIERTLQRLGH